MFDRTLRKTTPCFSIFNLPCQVLHGRCALYAPPDYSLAVQGVKQGASISAAIFAAIFGSISTLGVWQVMPDVINSVSTRLRLAARGRPNLPLWRSDASIIDNCKGMWQAETEKKLPHSCVGDCLETCTLTDRLMFTGSRYLSVRPKRSLSSVSLYVLVCFKVGVTMTCSIQVLSVCVHNIQGWFETCSILHSSLPIKFIHMTGGGR